MKVLLVGDPHGSEEVYNIPTKDIDLILIPGDLGKGDLMRKYAFANVGKKKSWTDLVSKDEVEKAY